MKNTNQFGKITVVLALALMAGCKERQEVTEAIRKEACETIKVLDGVNAKEMGVGCKKGVEHSEKIAASRYREKLFVDPDLVMLGALSLCYSDFGPQAEKGVPGNSDQLMGCNIGVMEALTYSKNVLKMLQVEKMKLADDNAESGVSQPVFSISIPTATVDQCTWSHWTDGDWNKVANLAPWTSGCIGFANLSPKELYAIGTETEKAQKNFIDNGKQAALRTAELDQEISKTRSEIRENEKVESQWRLKAAPMENALVSTSNAQARTEQERNQISQLLSDEQTLPRRAQEAWRDRDVEVAQAAFLTASYASLSSDLYRAQSDAERSRDEFRSAQRVLTDARDRRELRLRREREESERREAAARAERARVQRIEDDRRAAENRRNQERRAAERRAEDSRRVNSSSGSSSFGSSSRSNSSSGSSSFGRSR